ncbi:hypothetical protein Trydic_g14951 [Trypoxylus dichotomus]
MVVVEKNLCASDLCQLLAVKNRVAKSVNWSIVEYWMDIGAERLLEDHEYVLSAYRDMNIWSRHASVKFVFRKEYRKYEFFRDPQQFFPTEMIDVQACDDYRGINFSLTHSLQNLIQEGKCPIIFSQVWVRDPIKQIWRKAFLLLRDKKLYLSYNIQLLTKIFRAGSSDEGDVFSIAISRDEQGAGNGRVGICPLRGILLACLDEVTGRNYAPTLSNHKLISRPRRVYRSRFGCGGGRVLFKSILVTTECSHGCINDKMLILACRLVIFLEKSEWYCGWKGSDHSVKKSPESQQSAVNASLYYQNVRGLNSKTLQFYNNILVCADIDIVLLTEIWGSGTLVNSELFSEDSVGFWADRRSRRVGGVSIHAIWSNFLCGQIMSDDYMDLVVIGVIMA